MATAPELAHPPADALEAQWAASYPWTTQNKHTVPLQDLPDSHLGALLEFVRKRRILLQEQDDERHLMIHVPDKALTSFTGIEDAMDRFEEIEAACRIQLAERLARQPDGPLAHRTWVDLPPELTDAFLYR